MQSGIKKLLSNPVVKGAILKELQEQVFIYSRAFLNVITRKINNFSDKQAISSYSTDEHEIPVTKITWIKTEDRYKS